MTFSSKVCLRIDQNSWRELQFSGDIDIMRLMLGLAASRSKNIHVAQLSSCVYSTTAMMQVTTCWMRRLGVGASKEQVRLVVREGWRCVASACFPTLALHRNRILCQICSLLQSSGSRHQCKNCQFALFLNLVVFLFFFWFVQRLGDVQNGIHSVVHGCVDILCHR